MGLQLFKKLILLFCLFLLFSQVFASVYVVEPVDKKVSPASSEVLSFGKIARGETLKVVVKKKSDFSFDWDSLTIDTGLLPPGWKFELVEEDKTLIALITVGKDAPVSAQQLKFTASNSSEPLLSEAFYAGISVHESLLDVSPEKLSKETVLGETTVFTLILNNDSVASHRVEITTSLPSYWFSQIVEELGPNQTKTVELLVSPYAYGEKNFSINVRSLENSKSFSFPAKLDVKPTIAGMYYASIAGFPFFSPSLLPYYLLNSFLALFG